MNSQFQVRRGNTGLKCRQDTCATASGNLLVLGIGRESRFFWRSRLMRGLVGIVDRDSTYAKSTVARAKPHFMTAQRREARCDLLILDLFRLETLVLNTKCIAHLWRCCRPVISGNSSHIRSGEKFLTGLIWGAAIVDTQPKLGILRLPILPFRVSPQT